VIERYIEVHDRMQQGAIPTKSGAGGASGGPCFIGPITTAGCDAAVSRTSVQRQDGRVEQRCKGHPGGVRHEQPRRNAMLPPGYGDKGANGGEKQQHDSKRQTDLVGSKEHRRPQEVLGQLGPPQPHRPAVALALPDVPSGYGNDGKERAENLGIRRVCVSHGLSGVPARKNPLTC
jgi:hypothetical protein